MCKENIATSVRMPERLLSLVDNFAELHSMSRSSAINYLLTKGLFYEGNLDRLSDRISDIDSGKSKLIERDLIDD